jgi:chromosome segregation ATPase
MIKEELNNIDNPLPNETFTAAQAIQAVNRLLWSENVEDDDFEDARVIKAFLVGTLPNTPVQPKMSKNIPVMETTIEGAQKRIVESIEWTEWFIGAVEKAMEDDGYPAPTLSSLRTNANNLEYIGVFLDTVGDEMAAISSAHNSLHDRYVQADEEATNRLEEIDRWKDNFEAVDMAASRHLEEKIELQREITELRRENGELRRSNAASLSSIHAANDNS